MGTDTSEKSRQHQNTPEHATQTWYVSFCRWMFNVPFSTILILQRAGKTMRFRLSISIHRTCCFYGFLDEQLHPVLLQINFFGCLCFHFFQFYTTRFGHRAWCWKRTFIGEDVGWETSSRSSGGCEKPVVCWKEKNNKKSPTPRIFPSMLVKYRPKKWSLQVV